MEEINSCLDSYDELIYNYDELAWGDVELPKSVILETWYHQNQRADWWNMWCTHYSRAEASNYLTWKRLQGSYLCETSQTLDKLKGDYTKNPIDRIRKDWIISWYAQVKTLLAIKHSLANKRPIATWSNKINWAETKLSWTAVIWTWSWHRFHIIGYDDDKQVLICKNSYWPDYMIKGNFYIKYEDLWCLHNTKLSLIENKTLIDNYKQKIMNDIKLESAKLFIAREWKYTNWERPQDNITREEMWAILERVLQNNTLK